ncbi:MAG: NADH-quinone oxidoreductase subunit NuoH [Chloroflexi bacterium]|nr:NADH-quinone oxidoreductase subunit NuoH [Chloroflexota bacterium]
MDFINNIFLIIRDVIISLLVNVFVLPEWVANAIVVLLSITMLLGFATVTVLLQVWAERRALGLFQDRLGPNRVGPFGLLQTAADALKLLIKEDIIPTAADRWAFRLAPIVLVVSALLVYAIIPFGRGMIITDLNIGILYAISISSLATIGMLMAGWGSNNKYALLGAMRAAAQMVSYEIPLVLSIIGVVLLVGSLSTVSIVNGQAGLWFIIWQPIGFLVYLISAIAEVNRTPFDLVEAESEIIAGYHIEYSGMRWSLFFLAEYMNAFAISAIAATLFLGGWQGPILPPYVWFVVKAWIIFFILIWIRGTLPRVRVDQLMGFAWKVLIPVALLNIFITGGLLVPFYQSLVK